MQIVASLCACTVFLAVCLASRILISTFARYGPVHSEIRRPTCVPSMWPWIGNGLNYALHRRSFLDRCRDVYGAVFSTLITGRSVTFIGDPIAIAAVMRTPQDFSFDPIRNMVLTNAFGISRLAATSAVVDTHVYQIAFRHISQSFVKGTTTRFGRLLCDSFASFVATLEPSGSMMRWQDLIFPMALKCSSVAYFGRSFPIEEMYQDFFQYDGGFALLASGLPTFLFPQYAKARDNLFSHISHYLSEIDKTEVRLEDPPDLIAEVVKSMRRAGFSEKDVIGHLFSFLWGAQSNPNWAIYWSLAHILQNTTIITRLREEIDVVVLGEFGGDFKQLLEADPNLLGPTRFPLLNSLVKETLRISTDFIIARVAKQDTILLSSDKSGYHIKSGEWVFGLTSSIHHDEEIYDRPWEFRVDRFLSKDGRCSRKFFKCGKQVNNHQMFWGGGEQVCKGRFVAPFQLKAFVLLTLYLLDIKAIHVVRRSDGAPVADRTLPTPNGISVGVNHTDEDIVVICSPRKP